LGVSVEFGFIPTQWIRKNILYIDYKPRIERKTAYTKDSKIPSKVMPVLKISTAPYRKRLQEKFLELCMKPFLPADK